MPVTPAHASPQSFTITRAAQEQLHGHAERVLWLTGLSGAGKSTIANALDSALHTQGLRTYLLYGDHLRHGLNRDLFVKYQDIDS